MTVIGFTGSRHGMTEQQSAVVASILSARHIGFVHHGDCVGSDEAAHWMAVRLDIGVIVHPPEDEKWRAFCPHVDNLVTILGAKPYHDRNRDIVDAADIVVATPAEFMDPNKGGTWYTIRYARRQHKAVTVILPNGTITS